MSTQADKLKELNAESKRIAEEKRVLRQELDSTKGVRKEQRVARAAANKAVKSGKKELRELSASIMSVLKSKDTDAIAELADTLTETSSELVTNIRAYGVSCSDPVVEVEADDELEQEEV